MLKDTMLGLLKIGGQKLLKLCEKEKGRAEFRGGREVRPRRCFIGK